MRVGVPKEIKNHEYRVGMTPASVAELVACGHEVFVETKAGTGIDFSDKAYEKVGATILPTAADVFARSDMIVKVKEPQASEIAMLEKRHILFTYLHLAADKPQAEGLMKSGATCIAYETVTSRSGALPLLKPMSEVAGRMSVQCGAHYLEKEQGGRGVLLGGVPGVAPAKVAILGGGVAGINAAQIATGQRADVTIYDINNDRLAELDLHFGSQIKTAFASKSAIADAIREAELVIGAVLVPGAAAPKLVSRDQLKTMKRGSVLVDIAI
ncbi:MAG: alanine dehydrogenase, partial [Sphingomicrobium sp.]